MEEPRKNQEKVQKFKNILTEIKNAFMAYEYTAHKERISDSEDRPIDTF